MQGVINTTLLTQLLQPGSNARTGRLEPAQVHVLREKGISGLVQPLQTPLPDPDPCFPAPCIQSPWVLQ